MTLRPYQTRAVEAVEAEFAKGVRSTLISLATGCGKTVIFSHLAAREVRRGGRVLILAHRGELLEQAIDKLRRATGIEAGLEKAEETSDVGFDELPYTVVVGSVQSMKSQRRLDRFRRDEFSLVVIDECHHALTGTYRAVIDYFDKSHLLGVTATPDRGDFRSLSEVFQTIAFEYSIVDAIRDGYLCPIRAQTVPLKIDLTQVQKQGGDYQAASLGNALDPYLHQICREIKERCADRKTIVFTPLIATSQKMLDIFREEGVANVREVNGESQDRAETLQWFANAPKGCVLLNSMLLCLDSQTEILTDKGWVGMDDMTERHKIANWNFDGSVFFEEPKEIVRRPLERGREFMVSVKSQRCDIRVTSTHRMIVACGENGKGWKKIPAAELQSWNTIPTCGMADAFDMKVPQETRPFDKFRLSKYAYNIRRSNPSLSLDESKHIAAERIRLRESMHYKNPAELTLDECRFIGFWIADGSVNHLAKGGVEYTLTQSFAYPRIIEWIDNLLARIGFDFKRRIKRPDWKSKNKSVLWSLPRGTGWGCQRRGGVYSIEPFLHKSGTGLFWGMNAEQFAALIEGFWYGDGNHLDAKNGFPNSVYANNTNKSLIDLLSAIAVVRGWRCRVSVIPQKNPRHKTQYGIKMTKGVSRFTFTHKTSIIHEDFKDETVWCVRTTSKNIITRRNGRIAVMGNTEGYDEPSVDCICILRATKVRGLYCLDEQTEVLTKDGWKKDVAVGEEVLAFDMATGQTRFVPTLAKVRRPLETDEYFCSIKGQSCDIRVTNRHRMVYDNKRRTGWKFKDAQDIAALKDGAYLPVCGHGDFSGVPLSDDELRFIGWVMTDGSINRITNAICITQGSQQEAFCREIEESIKGCGFKFTRSVRKRTDEETYFNAHGDLVMWTVSKGVPRGRDKHLSGWGRLEPWLSKDLSPALFDMTERQFDIMLEAIYHGDGNKHWQTSYHIGKGNRVFIERLQMMAIQRGWRASVSVEHANTVRKKDLWYLHAKKHTFVKVGAKADKHRTWAKERGQGENCWCVETSLGTIVTRRNGKVSVVGNCQMVGRGTRLSPETGKRNLLILDFLWLTQTHDLCRPAVLITEDAEVAETITRKQENSCGDIDIDPETLEKAVSETVQKREDALAKKLEAQSRKKGKLIDPLAYAQMIGSADLSGAIPTSLVDSDRPTMEQVDRLEMLGFTCPGSATAAEKLLAAYQQRVDNDLSTPRQIKFLSSRGFRNVDKWPRKAAQKLINRFAVTGWSRIPAGIDPETYTP